MQQQKRKRAAAYCRVSTKSDLQDGSFETQCDYYRRRITDDPTLQFAGIYGDHGKSGRAIKGRDAFARLVRDCEAGKIDIIYTKSISRFARNTLECLTYVRHLQSIGVNLIFESNNIDTRTAFSEMLLTVLAAFAQEESRSISENTKWGIRKRYENGIARWCSLYGYAKGYTIVPEQAQIVREVFTRYEQGSTIGEIVQILQQRGIPSKTGKGKWTSSAVHTMLKNEKYAGHILLQKFLTADHISHKAVRNDCTEVPAYYIQNHHPPIVPQKTFDRVQRILRLRAQGSCFGKTDSRCIQYPFGGRLFCPFCGSVLYQRFLSMQPIKGRYWCCEAKDCTGFLMDAGRIAAAVCGAYNGLALDNLISSMQETDGSEQEGALQTAWIFKREHPIFAQAEYYWIDELITRIEIGAHRQKESCIITVYWKHGERSVISTGVKTKEPERLGMQYRSYLAEHEAERIKAAAQLEAQRRSDEKAASVGAILLGERASERQCSFGKEEEYRANHQNSADAGPAQAAGSGVLSGIDPS